MFNIELVKGYVKHRIQSKTRHGVHSPFVYKLVDEVIYDFQIRPVYGKIEALRGELLRDERSLTITDLGAGSLVNNSKQKQVKQLAKNALKSARLAQLIYRLAERFAPASVIELGTCLGITTSYLAAAVPSAKVISIEGCPETAAIAAGNLKALEIDNVELKVGNFDQLFPEEINRTDSVDFVFVDGNHRKAATLAYFEQVLPKVHENSVMIFDDIYWSKGMQEAWQQIKAHPQVTLTIDLFWIGLVFFRKGQAKEHFKIKY